MFEELLERNRARLARVARAYAPGADAQDLYQEILLQIWKSLDRFKGRSHPDTWAFRVALNTAMTWRRRKASRPVIRSPLRPSDVRAGREDSPLRVEDAPAPADTRDPLRLLDEFLASLTKSDRALLLLYLEDLTYREMAEILGISESYVGVKLNRIKQAFIERYIRG